MSHSWPGISAKGRPENLSARINSKLVHHRHSSSSSGDFNLEKYTSSQSAAIFLSSLDVACWRRVADTHATFSVCAKAGSADSYFTAAIHRLCFFSLRSILSPPDPVLISPITHFYFHLRRCAAEKDAMSPGDT
jgi:hypothetical protein